MHQKSGKLVIGADSFEFVPDVEEPKTKQHTSKTEGFVGFWTKNDGSNTPIALFPQNSTELIQGFGEFLQSNPEYKDNIIKATVSIPPIRLITRNFCKSLQDVVLSQIAR